MLVVLAVLGASCREAPENIQVTGKRTLTIWDQGDDPLIAPMPAEWRRVPSTQHRLFNYRFGNNKGEVYISRAGGGMLANANRWLQQFGKPELHSADEFQKIQILGAEGIVVSASGYFAGAMGKPPKGDMAVLGVIVGSDDALLTVKMIGPAHLVETERERLLTFCKKLRLRKTGSEPDVSSDSSE